MKAEDVVLGAETGADSWRYRCGGCGSPTLNYRRTLDEWYCESCETCDVERVDLKEQS